METERNRNSPAPPLDDKERVGATIRALRQAYGWSVGKFAESIGIDYSHLSNIEAGRKRCTPEIARRVADTLGVPLAAITTARALTEIS